MVARIATLSKRGRPHINPIYFVRRRGLIHLGTFDSTLVARNVRANPRVEILFNVEKDPGDHRVLRIEGTAAVRYERSILRAYRIRDVAKYFATPGGVRNSLAHARQLALLRDYFRTARELGRDCVLEVVPERAELLAAP